MSVFPQMPLILPKEAVISYFQQQISVRRDIIEKCKARYHQIVYDIESSNEKKRIIADIDACQQQLLAYEMGINALRNEKETIN